MHDRAGLRLQGSHTNVVPQLIEIPHVLAQTLDGHALSRGPQNITARDFRSDQTGNGGFEALTLRLVVDSSRDTNPFTARHVHQIA